MAIPETRPVVDDVRPYPVDIGAPCKMCGSEVRGDDGPFTYWDAHLDWHRWVWDQLNPA